MSPREIAGTIRAVRKKSGLSQQKLAGIGKQLFLTLKKVKNCPVNTRLKILGTLDIQELILKIPIF